jgi:hypothetical protein
MEKEKLLYVKLFVRLKADPRKNHDIADILQYRLLPFQEDKLMTVCFVNPLGPSFVSF